MAPVGTQDDKCESIVSTGAIKRSLYIGNGIQRGLVQAALAVRIGVRISGADMTDYNTKANCQRDDGSQTRIQIAHGCLFPFSDRSPRRLCF